MIESLLPGIVGAFLVGGLLGFLVSRVYSVRREAELSARLKAEESARLMLAEHYEKSRADIQAHFRLAAAESLEETTRRLMYSNDEQVDLLLEPLREQIDALNAAVKSCCESGTRNAAGTQQMIRMLMERAEGISEDAAALTRALRGDSKVQGDWGEMVLTRLFESTGLIQGVHYELQKSYRIDEHHFLRPDAVLRLPHERSVIVDAKVSLTAYTQYISAEDDAVQNAAARAHINSVANHVRELAAKSYEKLEPGMLDYVLMFIPNDSAYMVAVKHAPQLVHNAARRKVLLVSPSNFVVALQLVHLLWQKDAQQKSVSQIVERAALLYDKFAAFRDSFLAVGDSLRQADAAWQAAHRRLISGKGNFVWQVEKLRELGISPTKSLEPEP